MKDGVILKNNAKGTFINNQFIDNYNSIQLFDITQVNKVTISHNYFRNVNTLFSPYLGEKPLHGIYIDNCEHLNIGDMNTPESGNEFDGLSNGIFINIHIYLSGQFPLIINYYPISKINLYNNRFKDINSVGSMLNNEEIGKAVFATREDPFYDLRVSIKNSNTPPAQPLDGRDVEHLCGDGLGSRRRSRTRKRVVQL